MDYKKFKELKYPYDYLYSIVSLDDGRTLLRGCNRKSADDFINYVGVDNVKIFIY